VGRHRSDPRGLGRYLLLGVVGVAALALVVVGVFALRGALASKNPPHTSTPTPASTSSATPAADQRSTSTPVLLIKIINEPCAVFVKNAASDKVLRSDDKVAPKGATLRFVQAPLQVQISDSRCADVFVHGHKQRPPATQQWILFVQA
jgi:hypothetical protein